MTCAWWENGGGREGHWCPVHGWHGTPCCPRCPLEEDLNITVVVPPLIAGASGRPLEPQPVTFRCLGQ